MKALLQRVGVRLAFITTLAACSMTAQAADDVNEMFQMGRAAYYKGDIELAYQLLTQVEASNPRHFETKALLAQIRTQKKSGVTTVRKSYESVVIPKIEFTEVTLAEAVEGLRVLSKTASDGKVIPNIIIKDPALAAKTLTLSIRNLPLTDAIQYLADLSGANASYDKHAVIFSSAATAGN
ncbi:hypothetical protein [Prosthecobacter sp. SYSU 5D2]|uniref:hypothetical protein n=1 Tax=Prosthecobacter sp. SYSU 5D2 TaxID=3134134 RepID=UPI0031FEAB2C